MHFLNQRYRLLAYVVMNDHVHALVGPLAGHLLQDIVRSWKSYTAHELVMKFGRVAHVWQDEYFDRIMRDEAELREKANYILNNPWKRWPGTENYSWVGCFWEVQESEP
jgi:menaquinone-specific isochorismate synthase/putative DNA methylase